MSGSTFQWLKEFFGAEQAAEAVRPIHDLSERHLQAAGKLSTRLQASNLQIIGLQSVRDALGEEWQQRREAINQIINGAIYHRLEPGDAHFHLDTDDYLIVFVHLTHMQARSKAMQIAEEIRRLVLGELPDNDIQVISHVAEVDRDFVTSKIDDLHDLVKHIKQSDTQASGDVLLFDGQGTPLPGNSADSGLAALPITGAGPDLADLDQSLDALFLKKKSATYLKECQAAFYPNFSTRRRTFSFYTVSVTHMPSGRPADTSDPMLENPEELEFLLDRYRLTTALLGLHRMITGGHQGIIIIPVSFQTLGTSKLRSTYLSRFRDLPRGLFRSLCALVGNIPPGTPASRIADAITYLQPYCASRLLSLPPDPKLIDLYANTGCQGFETALPSDIADPMMRAQALANFAKRATWYKMESLLSNVSSSDEISLGATAGFSFLIGDAIAPMIATPGHRQALRSDHIPQRATAAPTG